MLEFTTAWYINVTHNFLMDNLKFRAKNANDAKKQL